MAQKSSSSSTQDERETQRQQYRKQLDTALDEEDDPLAVYHQFIEWTIKSYGETDPKSGLKQLLEEATRKFRNDPLYKADLRYLKLWTLYAKHSERQHALSTYKYLMTNEIGTSYSLLYEEYASALELEGRKKDADTIYRRGIKKQVRPLERLKSKYKDFQNRVGQIPPTTSSSNATSASSSNKPTADPQQKKSSKTQASNALPGTSKSSPSPVTNLSTTSTAASRYALMMAPPAPGKRPEKMRFNLSLLFSDGQEYSIQEARARSMGLLGKKWAPPPASEMPRSARRPDLHDDDGSKTVKASSRKKSILGGAEPTVTINTKEALADVFGMYNSPDKTNIFPGSKHAPVKRIDPITVLPRHVLGQEKEKANPRTPSTLQPFVDENSQPNRTTPGAKFTPFVDPNAHKAPLITPLSALSTKGVAIPVAPNDDASRLKSKAPVANDKPVFSKVFAPAEKFAPQRNASGETRKKDDLDSRAFTPFVDENAKTPFKVFSRPGEGDRGAVAAHTENGLAPKTPTATFTPFMDKTPAFTPFRDTQEGAAAPLTDKALSGPTPRSALPAINISKAKEEEKQSRELMVGQEEVTEEYGDEYQETEGQFEVPIDDGEYEEDEDQYYQDAPLGGRFGQFNVMTPITERTCEYTMGTTPKEPQYESAEEGSTGSLRGSNVFVPPQIGEHEALKNAERLAAELRGESDIEGEEEENEMGDEPEEGYVQVQLQQHQSDHLMDGLEEKAASVSLAEKRSPSQQSHFSNPCNPFEPTTLSILLSRIPSDDQFYDLHDQTSNQAEALEKFTRKSAPLSPYTLTLDGHRFMVSEKLGEGGFGSVYKARDMGNRTTTDEDDDYDDLDIDLDGDLDDDESSSLVAIKVVKPRNIWEYHVLRRLHASLPSSLCRSLVLPHALYAYGDESFLILSLCSQGMLLNIINNAVSAGVSQQGACLDELLVMFFSVELTRLVEGMHNAGFIHGDLKIDNCLLRLEEIPGGPSAWNAQYQPSGEGGWSYKGLKVIDFGRTIDTRMFPPGQEYLTDWATDERDCFELRQGRPWTFQTDYFGLAGIIYCMLFGKYIQESSISLASDSESETRRYKIGTPLKRYWQGDIWNRLFDALLNPCLVRPDGALPISGELASIRKDMEVWLQANCNRSSNTLKGLLKKVEKSCYTA